MRRAILLLLFLGVASSATAKSCDEFNAQLGQTYGFRPSALDDEGRARKSQQMDAVWSAVQKNPGSLAPCLRAALGSATDDGWFLFDGAQLLVSVDTSREAKELLLKGLTRVALDDVELRTWIAEASRLALEGFDTSELGKRWLQYPDAEYFLTEHGAYRVDRENGAMFLFGTLDERFATPVLAELALNATGPTKEIATSLLMSQATPEALAVLPQVKPAGLSKSAAGSLHALQTKPDLIVPRPSPKTSRADFLAALTALLNGNEGPFDQLIASVPDGERDLVAVATPADLDLLRKVRRYYMAKNDQHAIEWYNQFSQILMTLVWRPPAG